VQPIACINFRGDDLSRKGPHIHNIIVNIKGLPTHLGPRRHKRCVPCKRPESCCASTTLSPFRGKERKNESPARIQPKAERTLAFLMALCRTDKEFDGALDEFARVFARIPKRVGRVYSSTPALRAEDRRWICGTWDNLTTSMSSGPKVLRVTTKPASLKLRGLRRIDVERIKRSRAISTGCRAWHGCFRDQVPR